MQQSLLGIMENACTLQAKDSTRLIIILYQSLLLCSRNSFYQMKIFFYNVTRYVKIEQFSKRGSFSNIKNPITLRLILKPI